MPSNAIYRWATMQDAEILARMNHQLIRDEGHRNPMDIAQLAERMSDWLSGQYRAVVFESSQIPVGYALFRQEPDHVYLRQFFVTPDARRRSVGRDAIRWMWQNAWTDTSRLRIDVLVGNTIGRKFWASVGFQDYCITMESAKPSPSSDARSEL